MKHILYPTPGPKITYGDFNIRLSNIKWSVPNAELPDTITLFIEPDELYGNKKTTMEYVEGIIMGEMKLPEIKRKKVSYHYFGGVLKDVNDLMDTRLMDTEWNKEMEVVYVNIHDLIDQAFTENMDPELIQDDLKSVYGEGNMLYLNNNRCWINYAKFAEIIESHGYDSNDWDIWEDRGSSSSEDDDVSADVMYAGSGCESFDEFMDMYNSGEL